MKKLILGGFILGIILLTGFMLAQENQTNQTDTNQTENNQTSCTENNDCSVGFICENQVCILNTDGGNNETDNNQTDNNQTSCTEDNDCSVGFECKDQVCVLDTDNDDNQTDIDEGENETEEGEGRGRNKTRVKQIIKFEARTGVECPTGCRCAGVVMKCSLEDGGREMTIFAGNSGNVIVQTKGVNMTTSVTLFRSANGTLFGVFKGGEKEIKFLPDQVKAKIKERIRAKLEFEGIELNENATYVIKVKKGAKLFWIFTVSENLTTFVNSETGEIEKIKGPWWGFLARDIRAE